MGRIGIAQLISLCNTSKPDLAKIEAHIRKNQLTPREITYAAIKVCENAAFEISNFEYRHGKSPEQRELGTNHFVDLFDIFIRYGLNPELVFSDESLYGNIMWQLRTLQNGDIGAKILRNLLQKGGDPNIKIDGCPFFRM